MGKKSLLLDMISFIRDHYSLLLDNLLLDLTLFIQIDQI